MKIIKSKFFYPLCFFLLSSIIINLFLLKTIYPLRNHYKSFRYLKNKIKKYSSSEDIYKTDMFTLKPLPIKRKEDKYKFNSIFRTLNPKQYQDSLRLQIKKNLSLDVIDKADFNLIIHSQKPYTDYTEYKISYQTQVGVRIPAYLLLPKNVKSSIPAALISHGCGYGKAGVVGYVNDNHNSLGVDLVKSGFLVLAPDRRGFGELQPIDEYIDPSCGQDFYDGRFLLEHDYNINYNTSIRSLDVLDLEVAINYLESRKDVNSINLIGLSGGGMVSMLTAGLSDKIDNLVLSNSFGYFLEFDSKVDIKNNFNSYKKYKYPSSPIDLIQRLSDFRIKSNYTNNIDNMYLTPISLLPNTPLLIQFGNEDDVGYKSNGKEVISYIKNIYAAFGHSKLIEISIDQGEHELFNEPIINFLKSKIH